MHAIPAHRSRVHSRAYCNRRACCSGIFTHFSTASGRGSSKLLRKLKHGGALLEGFSVQIHKPCTPTEPEELVVSSPLGRSNGPSSLYTGVNGSENITAASGGSKPPPEVNRIRGERSIEANRSLLGSRESVFTPIESVWRRLMNMLMSWENKVEKIREPKFSINHGRFSRTIERISPTHSS